MRKSSLAVILLFISLCANAELGCDVIVENEPVGCSLSNILNNKVSLSILDKELDKETVVKPHTLAISKILNFVEVLHDEKTLRIERILEDKEISCPPFCIEPMEIKGVVTVGELETLAFISKLKEKKSRLLIDVRESRAYDKGTIPSALNLPFSMLREGSIYQEEVLKLLGASLSKKKSKQKWFFKNAQSLLIFGASASTNEASSAIKELLKLGYPSSKLLYYRSGIEAWRALGLTIS